MRLSSGTVNGHSTDIAVHGNHYPDHANVSAVTRTGTIYAVSGSSYRYSRVLSLSMTKPSRTTPARPALYFITQLSNGTCITPAGHTVNPQVDCTITKTNLYAGGVPTVTTTGLHLTSPIKVGYQTCRPRTSCTIETPLENAGVFTLTAQFGAHNRFTASTTSAGTMNGSTTGEFFTSPNPVNIMVGAHRP